MSFCHGLTTTNLRHDFILCSVDSLSQEAAAAKQKALEEGIRNAEQEALAAKHARRVKIDELPKYLHARLKPTVKSSC